MNATAKAILAAALRAARKRLGEQVPCPDWRLEGAFPLQARGKLWHLALDPADPLRLRHVPTGRCLCPPFREFDTDLASIPALLQKATRASRTLHLQADSFPRSAAFHDALYEAHWCWVVADGLALRSPVTRAQADAILYLSLASEGATVADGMTYHAAVRAAGARHWRLATDAPAWPPLFESTISGSPDGYNLPAESPAAVTAAPSGDSASCQSPAGASPCAPQPSTPQPEENA